ncbi:MULTISPECIES: alpha/beta fold hydrolase [Microbacterium]|uniref:alpha/beta fold hydrolase n=1 Tax=Microbacterium TaxID=33882 RepID=UPI0010F7B72E|nr:alpha/beta fold hydrolase [Microbacterium sp. 4NA327F11]MCK9913401.1 alpha/beta hydrolase [Microbacteriaceae bacterium K1510]
MVTAELADGDSRDTAPYTFTHDGSTLVVEEQGEGPVAYVLVHGIGMGRSVFADLAVRLRESGQVIALDLPGYGEAPEPPRTPTIERMADLVAAFLRHRGLDRAHGRVVLLGHSMGSQVATEVATRHPMLVWRLVLCAPTINIAERSAVRQLGRLAQDLWGESPIVLVRGAREYLRAGPNLRRKMRAMLAHRPEESYSRIVAPTLVIRGEGDPVSPHDWCRFVVEEIPDAHLVELSGHGHETMIKDAAAAAARIVAFARA